MLLDLQEKARKIELEGTFSRGERKPADALSEDVVSALVNLGYKKTQAERAVEKIMTQTPEITLEKALRASLQVIAAGGIDGR